MLNFPPMMATARMAVLGILLSASPEASAAQQPDQTQSTAPWRVGWANRHCMLVRRNGPDVPIATLRGTPGTRLWELTLVRRRWPAQLRGERTTPEVRLQPSGVAATGTPGRGETGEGDTISISGLRRDFIDRFAQSESITLGVEGRILFTIPIDLARDAIAALRDCEAQVLPQWGIDPEAFASLRVLPEVNAASFIADMDYPIEALRAGLGGTSTVRMTIDVRGRVAECVTVASSGHRVLDEASCRILTERVRAAPALDAGGSPVAAPLVTSITWQISG